MTTEIDSEVFIHIWADINAVRERGPLVHSITNFVVMNFNANVLLAAGASPVMAHAHEEVLDMVAIAQALVLNIGTLEPAWIESMRLSKSKPGWGIVVIPAELINQHGQVVQKGQHRLMIPRRPGAASA